jgi:very-short-patch-repair endonuclease
LCSGKGAQAVSTFLETFPDLQWDKETRLYKNPKSGCYCPFDFTNAEHKIIVEADGQQHFQFIPFFHRSHDEFESRALIDQEKERWAVTNGWLLIRVLSEDALYDQHEWKDYIRSHIDTRVTNYVHNGAVVTPDATDYIEGEYAIKRMNRSPTS